MHLFLSPHPDDAVLSCGGVMFQLAQAGQPVCVFTAMAGDIPPDVPISPFIQEHFERWALGPDPVPGRRQEDQAAVELLGGTMRFGPFADALYRTDGQGRALYPDLAGLFGSVHPQDPVLMQDRAITGQFDRAMTIYAPLGAGHHVDHQVVRDMAVRFWRAQPQVAVFLYEEYPYSADSADSVATARAALPVLALPVLHYVSDAAIEAKSRAIACYRSQISTFWTGIPAMAESVRRYAAGVGRGSYAERLWKPV